MIYIFCSLSFCIFHVPCLPASHYILGESRRRGVGSLLFLLFLSVGMICLIYDHCSLSSTRVWDLLVMRSACCHLIPRESFLASFGGFLLSVCLRILLFMDGDLFDIYDLVSKFSFL
ncbi:hypothetical protein B0T22DRAFT_1876 [Podospora appendiculata]|uniref:Uncharacterized protein n=1 Tax=Podospora appendiculata TaxID=314037 RepID=A0AAE1CEW7_9PEZI|nr:hypothetical protein B0T22DRAFT_1876 [Podospora appendiculata]